MAPMLTHAPRHVFFWYLKEGINYSGLMKRKLQAHLHTYMNYIVVKTERQNVRDCE